MLTLEDFLNYRIQMCLACDTEAGIRLDLDFLLNPHSIRYCVRKDHKQFWEGTDLVKAMSAYNKLLVGKESKSREKYGVRYTEYELGCGGRTIGTDSFDSPGEAISHAKAYNDEHLSGEEVPDWYIRADYIGRLTVP